MAGELSYLDATELAARIRARELSPVELVRALRVRASEVDPELNSIVTPFGDAEALARTAEESVGRGKELGPLHGVPFTIKDTFDTAGVRTTRGSQLFAEHVPGADAEAVARLRRAGAIPLGKTNTPEFALWWETENLVFGRTSNPWDRTRTAGGSSGGEAAAIAGGLSPLGIGSDVGGSIRLPAHYCGVVGLKPTHGRVPLTGHFPEILLGFMHAGFLARSVRDVGLALGVASGPDGDDWLAVPVPVPMPGRGPAEFAGLRAGILREDAFGPVDRAVAVAVEGAGEALVAAGCTVESARVPALEGEDWNVLTMLLYGTAGTRYWRRVVDGRTAELHPRLQQRLGAPPAPAEDYLAALEQVDALRRDTERFFARHDLLLCPTGPTPAHQHDADEVEIAGTACAPRTTMRATIPFDLTGSPALTVPFAESPEGLPIGVQLVGGRFDEAAVLAAGAALEEARGPLPRPPL